VKPIIVTCRVTKPVIMPTGGLNLSAILAWAVAENGGLPPPKQQPVPIEVPIACAWRSPDGWPLWLSTGFYPVDGGVIHRQWVHKRYPADRADFGSKMKINLAAGPFKEKRVPVAAHTATLWKAAALATDDDRVRELLSRVMSLGARAGHGFGAVYSWTLEDAPHVDTDFILRRRTVPIASGLMDGPVSTMPWTPPYWHAALWAPCVEPQPCF
jgi:hypothetical protein